MILPVFHLIVVGINMFTLWYDQSYVDLPFPTKELEEFPLKARLLFLTMWCLLLQSIYFSISLLNDIVGTNSVAPKKAPLIRRTKDILFSLAFPVAIYVAFAFWGIYLIDKEFIFPEEVEAAVPVWMNHVLHTLPVPFILIELLVTKRVYPSRKVGVNVMTGFIISYVVWIVGVYIKTGVWAYPFLELINWPSRFWFTLLSSLGGVAIYVIGEKINYAVWPNVKTYANGVSGKRQ